MPAPTTSTNHLEALALLAIAAGDDKALADILASAAHLEAAHA